MTAPVRTLTEDQRQTLEFYAKRLVAEFGIQNVLAAVKGLPKAKRGRPPLKVQMLETFDLAIDELIRARREKGLDATLASALLEAAELERTEGRAPSIPTLRRRYNRARKARLQRCPDTA